MPEISKELDALTSELIGAAIEALEEGRGVAAMLACDAEDDILSFEGDDPDGCYSAACEHVRGLGPAATRYALLVDGAVSDDAACALHPALIFEFAERGMQNAWSGFVTYETSDAGIEVGEPQPAGAEELLFG